MIPDHLAFRCTTEPPRGALNALELDGISVRPADTPATPADEAVVVPDRHRPDDETGLLGRASMQVVRLWADWNAIAHERGRWRGRVQIDEVEIAYLDP